MELITNKYKVLLRIETILRQLIFITNNCSNLNTATYSVISQMITVQLLL